MEYARKLEEKAQDLFRQKTAAEWLGILGDRGIPAGPVRFVEELFEDEQIEANGLVTEVEHRDEGKVKMIGAVAHFEETPLAAETASPALGEHTREILGNLGCSDDEIDRWKEAGVVA